jgi:type II secretory pathway component PulM
MIGDMHQAEDTANAWPNMRQDIHVACAQACTAQPRPAAHQALILRSAAEVPVPL